MEYRIIASYNSSEKYISTSILSWYRNKQTIRQSLDIQPSNIYKPFNHRGQIAKPKLDSLKYISQQTQEGVPKTDFHNEAEYIINPEIKIRKIGNAGGKEQDFFHWYMSRLLVINLHGYPPIYWRTITSELTLRGREGALLGTESFPPGTVGYGVHASIRLIRGVLSDYGEAQIGELFNRPDVQTLLAMPNTVDNNRKVAKLEYEYWEKVKNNSPTFSEDWVGGKLGYQFNPSFRTYFPIGVTGPVRQTYNYVQDEVVDPITGIAESKVNEVKTFAQKRIQQLKELFPDL